MNIRTAAGAAALAILSSIPMNLALAHSPAMAVVAPPTLTAWSTRVFQDLDRVLVTPTPIFGRQSDTGIVAVKFNCSESGAPANVTLYKSSGSRKLDAATVRAVQRIATLHPLPAGMLAGQNLIVRVLFANSMTDARGQIAQMRADADKSNAWFGKGSQNLAVVEIVPNGG